MTGTKSRKRTKSELNKVIRKLKGWHEDNLKLSNLAIEALTTLEQETSSVIYREGGDGPIDEELMPLLEELNKAGLKTTQSCCGHGKKRAYLAINMKCVEDVAIRQNGRRLVIWWKYGKPKA